MLTLLTPRFNPAQIRGDLPLEPRDAVNETDLDADRRCLLWPCRWVRDACAVALYITVMTMVLVSLASAIAWE